MRELLILILGLAVIAVILRGLYVAIHARRGQIRLAIDRNIPSDVDLDELEMSELPSGGARVVRRSLEQVNRHNSIQNELDLDNEAVAQGPIPVLMDSVELRERGPDESNSDAGMTEFDEDEFTHAPEDEFATSPDDTCSDASEDDSGHARSEHVQTVSEEDFDDVYDEPETAAEAESTSESVVDDWDDEERDEEYPQVEAADQEDDYSEEPQPDSEDFEDNLDSISMTAGDRIGDHEFTSPRPGVRPRPQKESLFSRFSRRGENHVSRAMDTDDEESLFEQTYDTEALSATSKNEAQQMPVQGAQEGLSGSGQRGNSRNAGTVSAPHAGREGVADFKQAREHRKPEAKEVTSTRARAIEPSEVLVINVMSREGQMFQGRELLQVLTTAGLRHGDMDIFHRHLHGSPDEPIVFSVANILNPGTFDPHSMNEITTRGVSLFLAMPAVISNQEAFEQMLQVAQQIRGALDGELRDDHRNVMTSQTIAHYRQRIQDYELRKLKAAQAQS